MPKVSIAVPVFNGEAYLGEALACLEAQTFSAFEVVVCDNASTDRTAAIAGEFATRDRRFRVITHDHNIGMMPNFMFGVETASADFFLWRAFDDLCDPDYLTCLLSVLEANPQAALAAPLVRTSNMDGGNPRQRGFPALTGSPLADTLRLMFGSTAGWFYGMWRREALLQTLPLVMRAYPQLWGNDHLTMLPAMLQRRIVFAPQATFIQRLKKTTGTRTRSSVSAAAMRQNRRDFAACASAVLQAVGPRRQPQRAILTAALLAWRERRTYRMEQLIKAAVRGQ